MARKPLNEQQEEYVQAAVALWIEFQITSLMQGDTRSGWILYRTYPVKRIKSGDTSQLKKKKELPQWLA